MFGENKDHISNEMKLDSLGGHCFILFYNHTQPLILTDPCMFLRSYVWLHYKIKSDKGP